MAEDNLVDVAYDLTKYVGYYQKKRKYEKSIAEINKKIIPYKNFMELYRVLEYSQPDTISNDLIKIIELFKRTVKTDNRLFTDLQQNSIRILLLFFDQIYHILYAIQNEPIPENREGFNDYKQKIYSYLFFIDEICKSVLAYFSYGTTEFLKIIQPNITKFIDNRFSKIIGNLLSLDEVTTVVRMKTTNIRNGNSDRSDDDDDDDKRPSFIDLIKEKGQELSKDGKPNPRESLDLEKLFKEEEGKFELQYLPEIMQQKDRIQHLSIGRGIESKQLLQGYTLEDLMRDITNLRKYQPIVTLIRTTVDKDKFFLDPKIHPYPINMRDIDKDCQWVYSKGITPDILNEILKKYEFDVSKEYQDNIQAWCENATREVHYKMCERVNNLLDIFHHWNTIHVPYLQDIDLVKFVTERKKDKEKVTSTLLEQMRNKTSDIFEEYIKEKKQLFSLVSGIMIKIKGHTDDYETPKSSRFQQIGQSVSNIIPESIKQLLPRGVRSLAHNALNPQHKTDYRFIYKLKQLLDSFDDLKQLLDSIDYLKRLEITNMEVQLLDSIDTVNNLFTADEVTNLGVMDKRLQSRLLTVDEIKRLKDLGISITEVQLESTNTEVCYPSIFSKYLSPKYLQINLLDVKALHDNVNLSNYFEDLNKSKLALEEELQKLNSTTKGGKRKLNKVHTVNISKRNKRNLCKTNKKIKQSHIRRCKHTYKIADKTRKTRKNKTSI